MVSAKLSTSTSQRFVIDIVPELTSMLRAEGFRSGSRASKMENFERRHEVLFALELHIAEERLLLEKKSDADSDNKIDTKDLSPELSAFIKGIDEADKGRLEKRLEAYHQCAEPFLNYFQKTKRVVKMDLQVPHNPDLQPTIRQLFTNFGFARNNDCIRVVLFVTRESHLGDIDLEFYKLRKIRLSEVSYDRDETLSQQIRAVRKFIYRSAQPNENILVVLNCLNNTDYPPAKRINFLEYKTTYLDYFIRNRERRTPRARCKMPFRAITSTTAELCLFPETMPSK
ncbi:Protein F38E11.6 a, partial [Aphelenchoides avenae]